MYIVLCIGFDGVCSFGIADTCQASWYNFISLELDFLPQVFGIIMMVKIILALKNRVEYTDVIDITAIIAQKKQHKLLVVLIIRICGAFIMLIWNLILLFVALENKTIIDFVLELVYKLLYGVVFLIRIDW